MFLLVFFRQASPCVTFLRRLWRRRLTPPCATSSTCTDETLGSTRPCEKARASRAWSIFVRWRPGPRAFAAKPWVSLVLVRIALIQLCLRFLLPDFPFSVFFFSFCCRLLCAYISSGRSVCLLLSCPDKVIFLPIPIDYLKVVSFASLRAGFLLSAALFAHPTALVLAIISLLLSLFSSCLLSPSSPDTSPCCNRAAPGRLDVCLCVVVCVYVSSLHLF